MVVELIVSKIRFLFHIKNSTRKETHHELKVCVTSECMLKHNLTQQHFLKGTAMNTWTSGEDMHMLPVSTTPPYASTGGVTNDACRFALRREAQGTLIDESRTSTPQA